ncbi:MAG: hypothetical protein GXP22_06535 [Gammaproteobacteria bacterium]|nr:hypothetical protein [Gammaproteobacteria bacterium]
MNKPRAFIKKYLGASITTLLTLGIATSSAYARHEHEHHDNNRFNITLMQLSDVHGNIIPHAGVIHNPDGTTRYVQNAGGVAKLKTLVNEVRASSNNSLLLAVGDSTHGTAETMFTIGDAIMPALNAFGIDAYTPGNWEFGYGPAVFRNRFTAPTGPLPANLRVMANAYDGPGVTKATFPTLAVNIYNANGEPIPAPGRNRRVLPAYKVFDMGGEPVAVIGITASIVPQQANVFNIGFRFTQGIEELPGIIDEIKDQGIDMIVVQSELGLPQNIQIGKMFKDVDVVLSAHTHELTLGALLVNQHETIATTPGSNLSGYERHMLAKGAAIVVETTEDLYLGRLDLRVRNGHVRDFKWTAIPVDDDVIEDPAMKIIADAAEEPFIAGADNAVARHSFMPGGYCPANNCGDVTVRGHQLTEDLDTVVGYTDVLLKRSHVLEDVINNVIADAMRSITDPIVSSQTDWTNGVDLSMTNGFRFGNVILSSNEGGSGEITLRDLYTQFPISPAVAVAEFSGLSIERDLESVLSAVFNRNPFLQRGGWYVGLSNITQKVDLDNRPFGTSSGRIVETMVGGVPLDPSKRYVFASCFPHGEPLDRICRTNGGEKHQFFELANADDYNSAITVVPPLNTTNIIRFITHPVTGRRVPIVKQVAPDRFVHPVQVLRRFLDENGTIYEADFAVGRVQNVDSTTVGNPASPAPASTIDPLFIQPPEGMGPNFFAVR